ncbi:hypothetical protein FACS189493_1720 [Spirochaetia bacterium]|nr:hypothetical protein FACS189493_1720 [Spirochaetia bacterium]
MDLACCIAASARSRSGELWGRSGSETGAGSGATESGTGCGGVGCGAGVGVLGAADDGAGSSAGGVD